MKSIDHHFTSPTTQGAGAATRCLRGVFSMILASSLLGTSSLLAGCSDAGGTPANTDAASGTGGGGGEGTGGDESGGGGDDAGVGGGRPSGECAGDSTIEANTDPDDPVQQAMDRLVRDDKFPAVLVAVRDLDGKTRHYTAGVGDLETQAKVPVDGQVRIGSNTKPFTAVVVLQLVGEGKVDLDAPIEAYLPDLIRGEGIDGREITVRQLLRHESGLPDFVGLLLGEDLFKAIRTYVQPRALLDLALTQPGKAPGTEWAYSNTNYIIAGLLVEKVTGRPLAEEVTRRIIDRIGLSNTYVPEVGEQGIRRCHPRGYHANLGEPLRDVTELDPSIAGASGNMISTPSDMNRFFTALLDGELLEPAELEEMRATVDASSQWPGYRYGLGLSSLPLRCGGVVWGHGGDIFGYETSGGVAEDGRSVTVAVTALPSAVPGVQTREHAYAVYENVLALTDTALCD
ncbi:alkaline D-peptidase [Sorangium cellulosum]|uniref:Alkaline D-peptidase n=1 Tax=Sorangium cellulosum TaxID=56 RepID=A0A150PBL5_SORCE|nr:serine hydrolase domain-containing protein [Sorangium cellulosum]KYF53065.1 alkaline D-peptidase [Sorangium cellulosum]